MPTLHLIFDTGEHEVPALALNQAYKLAVNELISAVHDNLPPHFGHAGEKLLQDAFTIMSFAGDPYEERYDEARKRWLEFIETYGTSSLRRARTHPGVLLDVTVEDELAPATTGSTPWWRDEWAYHATHRRWYEDIRASGLEPCTQPAEHADEPRDFEGPCIYFMHTPEAAEMWNDIVLRFPWPSDTESGTYDDWRSESWVPAEDIQVRVGEEWRPLIDTPLTEVLIGMGKAEDEPTSDSGSVGARPATKWKWLPAEVVYKLEPVAAAADVSRVARHRPAAGGWLDATKRAGEKGEIPSPAKIKAAIRKAEKEVGAPFYAWEYGSGSSQNAGLSYKKARFTDDANKKRTGDYGFMAFYDWVTAEGLDPDDYLTRNGDPDEEAIARLASEYNDPERFAEWFSDWLRYRHNFLARHLAQMKGDGLDDEGLPTKRHLGLVMWAGSPTPDRLLKRKPVAAGTTGAKINLPTPITWERATEALGNRAERKIANNTTLTRPRSGHRFSPEEIIVSLHHTPIMVLTPTSTYVSTGGHATSTTRQRIQDLLHIKPYVRAGVMYVDVDGERVVIPGERGRGYENQEYLLLFGEGDTAGEIEVTPPEWPAPTSIYDAYELLERMPLRTAAIAALTAREVMLDYQLQYATPRISKETGRRLVTTMRALFDLVVRRDAGAVREFEQLFVNLPAIANNYLPQAFYLVGAVLNDQTESARALMRRLLQLMLGDVYPAHIETYQQILDEWWHRVQRRLAFRDVTRAEVQGRRSVGARQKRPFDYTAFRERIDKPRKRVVDIEPLLRPYGRSHEWEFPDYDQVDEALNNMLMEEAVRCAGKAVGMVVERVLWASGHQADRHVDRWLGRVRSVLDGHHNPTTREWSRIAAWADAYSSAIMETWYDLQNSGGAREIELRRTGAAIDAANSILYYALAFLPPDRRLAFDDSSHLYTYAADLTKRDLLAQAVGSAMQSWAYHGPMSDDLGEGLEHQFWDLWWSRCQQTMGVQRRSRPDPLWAPRQ